MSKRDARIEARAGTYLLILAPRRKFSVVVGGAGRLDVEPGYYVYVGSAGGPGGLFSRVSRHQRRIKRSRWHIDYLTRAARVEEVWFSYDAKRREHDWARAVGNLPGAGIPMRGFGSSDCRCRAHLFYSTRRPSFDLFRREVHRILTDSERIHRLTAERKRLSPARVVRFRKERLDV